MSFLIPGKAYTATAPDMFGRPNTNTYLLCDRHLNDEFTGDRLPEPNYLFIVWQDNMMTRMLMPVSEAETRQFVVKKGGLTTAQMAHLASTAFREWQGREYPQTLAPVTVKKPVWA